jgi:hypothetical protein
VSGIHEIHDYRSRLLTADQVRRALDVDVPSDSDDDRFDISDDSDADPDYKKPDAPGDEESSEEEDLQELPELNEPDPVFPATDGGPSEQEDRGDGRSNVAGRPAKKPRAEWIWSDEDLPFKPSPEHKFIIKGNCRLFFNVLYCLITLSKHICVKSLSSNTIVLASSRYILR